MARLSTRDWLVDAVIAGAFLAVGQLGLHLHDGSTFTGTAPAAVTAVADAAIAVPLLWRRRYPLGTLIAVAVAMVLPRAFGEIALPLWGGLGCFVVALYSASRWAPRPKDALALVVPALVLVAFGLEIPHFSQPGEYAFSVPVILAGWLIGQAMRRWHQMSQLLRGHLREMEQTEAARHAAAVADERARIARELHDVVAHAVSVMVVQSGSARLKLRTDPTGSEEALRSVEQTGRQALVEMRHMLGLLRSDTGGPALAPQPSVRALGSLVDSMRASGHDVELHTDGAPVALPPGLDLSAYRIVQEALTNAVRHAGRVPVRARVSWGQDSLTLEVVNGRPPAPVPRSDGSGHGLIGMRERCELFGGTVSAGKTPEGGFRVHARLPLPETATQRAGSRVGESVG
jgi:signal transduction histidine kinase